MEPQIIDHYNEMPSAVNVIDKLNEENDELQKENEKLRKFKEKQETMMKKFQMPRIKVDTVEEYNEMEQKVYAFGESLIEFADLERMEMVRTMPGSWHIDPPDEINRIIGELNRITRNLNREWCEYRVKISFEIFAEHEGSGLRSTDVSCITSSKLSDIILGLEEELPEIYCELSTFYIPEWSYRGENVNLLNMCYYHCEKCNKLDDYGEPEMYGNQLLCMDCQ